jgi:hypothetical protein
MYNKEAIYDEKISPLMAEIIKICKESNIQMVATYFIKEDAENEDGDLYCTTYIPSSETRSQKLVDIYNVLYKGYEIHKPFVAAITITQKEAHHG